MADPSSPPSMPSDEPKPCPFCGNAGRAQRRNHSDRFHGGEHDWLVVCPGNGCCSRSGKTEREAIAKWNRRALPLGEGTDTERLDWLENSRWVTMEKTDESDNNGVGLVDSAVRLMSCNPDGEEFGPRIAATFREAIDKAKADK